MQTKLSKLFDVATYQRLAQRLLGLTNGSTAPELRVRLMSKTAKAPTAQRRGDAGLDLAADHAVRVTQHPTAVYTGVQVAIPEGYVGFICPRSGLAAKSGITVTNAPGVIDSNYRGELIVLLNTVDDRVVSLKAGERIAQLVLVPCVTPVSTIVDSLDTTNRGTAGFGSSGR